MKYTVIIPAKNEESNIGNALRSLLAQTILPQVILVIDDGSTDKTLAIVEEFEALSPLVKHVVKQNEKKYSLGGHVLRMFNEGMAMVDSFGIEYDWIIKMDADIEFNSDFMESIAIRIAHKRMGIVSGTPYYFDNGQRINEVSPIWHTHGQFKIYNRDFMIKTGAIPEFSGWDTADNIKARVHGWDTLAIRDVYYKMSRKIGGKSSLKKGRIRHGVACYALRYSFIYFMVKMLHDIFKRPFLLGSCYLTYGYIKSFFNRPPKILTEEEGVLLRKLLWESFFERFKNKEFMIFQKLNTKQIS